MDGNGELGQELIENASPGKFSRNISRDVDVNKT